MSVLSAIVSKLSLASRRPSAAEELMKAQAEAYGIAWDESRWAAPTREMREADRMAVRAAANDARFTSRRGRACVRLVRAG